jgi:hypothetical protein
MLVVIPNSWNEASVQRQKAHGINESVENDTKLDLGESIDAVLRLIFELEFLPLAAKPNEEVPSFLRRQSSICAAQAGGQSLDDNFVLASVCR